MRKLANLIPDPSTAGCFVLRPAALMQGSFGGFANPGFVSGLLVVGNTAYGLIASTRFPGKDEPFSYDLLTGAYNPVSNVLNANTPTSPMSQGAWVPPILKQVGSRIIVTHPGFPGAAVKFGWFDVSGASFTITGNTNTNAFITGNPSILAIQPGMFITGTNIPAAATVVSTVPVVVQTTGDTHTSTLLDNIPSTSNLAVGMAVAGAWVPAGTTIAAILGATSVTLSAATLATVAAVVVTFTGALITLSAAATGSTNGSTFTVTGGTMVAPLWGAGDTDRNPLPSVPVGVAQFNGRAYFALERNGIVYSDSGFPCRVSNSIAVQALLTYDGLPVTAIGELGLNTQLGGIVQSLIAFQGASKMQQITGDQVTLDLKMNAMSVPTGTLAPLSIAPTEKGLSFISPQGLRIIDTAARVSDVIGDEGRGIALPFTFALVPSRICAAANVGVIRISTQDGNAPLQPQEEFWYDYVRQKWTGPHTFPASLIQPWASTFLLTAPTILAQMWKSDAYQTLGSIYTENGVDLSWAYETVLLPDNADVAMNALVEMTLAIAIPVDEEVLVLALDENDTVLDMVSIPPAGRLPLWGAFIWGEALWGGVGVAFQQHPVQWNAPLVFKQIKVRVVGNASPDFRLGNLYMKYQILGYKLLTA